MMSFHQEHEKSAAARVMGLISATAYPSFYSIKQQGVSLPWMECWSISPAAAGIQLFLAGEKQVVQHLH